MSKKTCQYTDQEMLNATLHYRSELLKRVQKKRLTNDKNLWVSYDLPRVVVSCSSKLAPYLLEKGHNCRTLKNCHNTLISALPAEIGTIIQKPIRKFPGMEYYEVGHCAEFHAAHKLLNAYDKIKSLPDISYIAFSLAIKVSSGLKRSYCGTCKETFNL